MNRIYQGEDAPCKDCASKYIGCHGECASYIDYQQKREAERIERRKLQEIAEVQYWARMRRRSSRRRESGR